MSARGVPSRRLRLPLAVVAALAAALPAGASDPTAGTRSGVGPQRRVSDLGDLGDPAFDAASAAVAYNPVDHEFLVVWSGDDDRGGMIDGELEIFGQRLDASTGDEIGADDFRISDMGGTGDVDFLGVDPAVVYNGERHEYLVVWTGEDDVGGLVDGELEIFGQRLDAATGAEVGANDFRISDLGPDGSAAFRASAPDLAYNAQDAEYLVVWMGDDDAGGLVDQEFEIFGQRLEADGAEVGANDFRISDAGGTGNTAYAARNPAVTYDGAASRYLIVWEGDDDVPPLVDDEFEIFGQRLDADGAEVGANDFRISDLGPDGSTGFLAFRPDVAHSVVAGEYLVVWHGDDDAGGTVDDEVEIRGQRLDASGSPVGPNDFRVSRAGPDGDPAYVAFAAAVAFDPRSDRYLVVWSGDDALDGRADDELEISGRLLGSTGAPIGSADLRLSAMGPDGDADFDAFAPALAADPARGGFLVAWHGDHDVDGTVDDEFEVHVRRAGLAIFADGFGTGDTIVWSSTVP